MSRIITYLPTYNNYAATGNLSPAFVLQGWGCHRYLCDKLETNI